MTNARIEFLRQRPPRLSDGELARHQRGGAPPVWPDAIGIRATPRTEPVFPRDYKTRREPASERWLRIGFWLAAVSACLLFWSWALLWAWS